MSELHTALKELVDELTERADALRNALALVLGSMDGENEPRDKALEAIDAYDNFIKEA